MFFSLFLFSYLPIALLFSFVYLLIHTIPWSKKKNLTCFETLLSSAFNISSLVVIHSYVSMLLRFNTDALLPLYFNAFWFNIFTYLFSLLLNGFSCLFKVEAVALRYSGKKLFLEISQNLAQVFSCGFFKVSKNTFSYRTPPEIALVKDQNKDH